VTWGTTVSTSDVYVWVWLPDSAEPVPCGLLRRDADGLNFRYGNLYIQRPDAISLAPQLPLGREWFAPDDGIGMPSAIKDAAPDAWGQRVLWHAELARNAVDKEVLDPSMLSDEFYLLGSGSDRIGAIDFQASSARHVPRTDHASLDDLHRAVQAIDRGEPLPESLAVVIEHATSVGGARPKATLTDGDGSWLAKFSSSSDTFDVVGAEAASTYLAARAGIDVPEVQVVRTCGRKAVLTRRFDRPGLGRRRIVLTAVTVLNHGLGLVPRGSYPEFVDALTSHGADAGGEMFSRAAFSIAITNTDDHLRNHSAFWDGQRLALTPAYDLSPGRRTGETASLATPYTYDGQREANFASLARAAGQFGITASEAATRIETIRATVADHFEEAADLAQIARADREALRAAQFLNRGTLYGWEPPGAHPSARETPGRCGRPTLSGAPCRRVGRCPHHP